MGLLSKQSKQKPEHRIKTHREDYAYATGRIRALETSLLSRASMTRLFEAEDPEDIAKVLTDNGLAITDSIEDAVRRDQIDSYALVLSLIPNREYVEALLLANDYHNLKVILKGFIPDYQAGLKAGTTDCAEMLDNGDNLDAFFSTAGDYFSEDDMARNFAYPSNHDPMKLLDAIRSGRNDLPDGDFVVAVEDAIKAFVRLSDPGAVDAVVDRHYFERLADFTEMLDNRFFSDYIAFKADSTNLAMMLRLRAMKADVSRFEEMVVRGSAVSGETLIRLYSSSNDDIKEEYRFTSCEDLALFAESFGSGRSTLEFGKAVDNHIIDMLDDTRRMLFGPEILLAFLIAKDMQARNINIALTCVRNRVPMSIAAEMMRSSF